MDTLSQVGCNAVNIPDLIEGVKFSMEELGYSTSTLMRLLCLDTVPFVL